MNAFYLFTPILLLLSGIVTAQTDLEFSCLTDEDGLSNGFVTSLHQCETGFIWLGTPAGLNRYDGYTFRIWTAGNAPERLSNEIVWDIFGSSDRMIWVGTELGLNCFDPESEAFIHYLHDPLDATSLGHDRIQAINEDKAGNIWVGTDNGLSVLHLPSQRFQRYFYYDDPEQRATVRGIIQDKNQDLWFGFKDTLYQYVHPDSVFRTYPLVYQNRHLANYHIRSLYYSETGQIWLSTRNKGIFMFDPEQQNFLYHLTHDLDDPQTLSHAVVSDFNENELGTWIGTNGGGLNILDPGRSRLKRFVVDPFDARQDNFSTIRSMLQDQHDNLWLGTFYGGVKTYFAHNKPFQQYYPVVGKPDGLQSTMVNSLAERPDGTIWVQGEHRMELFDPQTNIFSQPLPALPIQQEKIAYFLEDRKGDFWICTSTNGLWKYHLPTQKWQKYTRTEVSLDNLWLNLLYEDQQGRIWIGSQNGLFVMDAHRQMVRPYPLPSHAQSEAVGNSHSTNRIQEDQQGHIWVATHGGLHHLHPDPARDTFYAYAYEVYNLLEKNADTLWLGTSNGLAFFDRVRKVITPARQFPDLQGAVVDVLVRDGAGNVWTDMNKQLFKMHPDGSRKKYNQKDGLLNTNFFPATLLSSTGELYFPGPKGFDRFHPAAILDDTTTSQTVITEFRIFNQVVPIQGSADDTLGWISPLTQAITYAQELRLPYNKNDFSFQFAYLHFNAPENNRYRYQLQGYDADWIATAATQRLANYTNLNWGTYIFRVQGANRDGYWGAERQIKIDIAPPWWASWWAILLYVTVFFAVAYNVYYSRLRQALKKVETRQLREMHAAKAKLYTNITHEFRTPLTIILGLVDQVKNKITPLHNNALDTIKRNGLQLLELVNQMLDLAKLDAGFLRLQYQQDDLVAFVKSIIALHDAYAESKMIHLVFSSKEDEIFLDFDPTRLQQVLSNLISNAIKFSPKGSTITVTTALQKENASRVDIRVHDDGPGIPAAQLPFIFDRFFQIDDRTTRPADGSGIGLTLVKELTALMLGQVKVSSTPGKGTVFTVSLPIQNKHPLQTQTRIVEPLLPVSAALSSLETVPEVSGNKGQPLLLIVEDNAEMRAYLREGLQASFRLIMARHGQEGIDKALEWIPDLIITDVMMPGVDGYTLCAKLKKHELSSHIPIVMLTAKADTHSRLGGLRKGADAYLAKPFLMEELSVRIHSLLDLRQKLQHYYLSKLGFSETGQLLQEWQDTSTDDQFLSKVNRLLDQNLDNSALSVEQLSQAMYVSSSKLYRKIMALTGQSPHHYIRSFRLLKAKRMLTATDYPIGRIASEVGFSDQKYFSRLFKKSFGMTPTQYRNAPQG